ncbi:MAG: hypothetical protein WC511_02860 [Candidatus Pacearchaeota archaeon]
MLVHLRKDEKSTVCGEKVEVLKVKGDKFLTDKNIFLKMKSLQKCKKCMEAAKK